MKITEEQLAAVCTGLGNNVEPWLLPLNAALETIGADTPARAADFVAQWAHESAEFTRLEEGLNYSASQLLLMWPSHFTAADVDSFAHQPERIANRAYANRMGNGPEDSGDGWLYRGGGLPMITGRDNYRACSLAICGDADTLLNNPEQLLDPNYAMAAAAWYWAVRDLNAYSDRNDFDGQSDLINIGHVTKATGDAHGFAQRLKYRVRAQVAFGIPQ